MSRLKPQPGPPPAIQPKSRFRYQRDGVDVGPFSYERLRDEVRARRANASTLVFEERSQSWFKLGDEPGLAALEHAVRREAEHNALIAETHAATRAVKSSHSRRWWVANVGILLFVGAAAGGAWLLLGTQRGQPSNVRATMFRPLQVSALQPWTPATEDSEFVVALATPAVKPEPKRVPRKPVMGGEKAPAVASATERIDTNVSPSSGRAVEMDFSDEEIGGTANRRTLGQDEIARLSNRLGARLTPCLEAEMGRTPGFSGVTVEFTLEPSGKARGVQLSGGGSVTAELLRCAKQKVEGASVEPFAGDARVVRIPLRIRSGP